MNGTPSNGTTPNFGQIGASPSIDFFNFMVSAFAAFSQRQLQDSADLFQRAVTGEFDLERMMKDLISLSLRWVSLANIPAEWVARFRTQAPAVFFIVDEDTETLTPQSVTTPIVAQDFQIELSGFWNLNLQASRAQLPMEECISAELKDNGNRLEIRPVSLLMQDLEPGLHVGVVHGHKTGETTRQLLALVYLLAPFEFTRFSIAPPPPIPTEPETPTPTEPQTPTPTGPQTPNKT
jgi:hypothetical protein